MTSLTVSNSGTAWIRDMKAQGKDAAGGWANSPDAAYYASLDGKDGSSVGSAKSLPTSLEALIKMQQEAAKKEGDDDNVTTQMQDQLNKIASDGIPPTGNVINVKA